MSEQSYEEDEGQSDELSHEPSRRSSRELREKKAPPPPKPASGDGISDEETEDKKGNPSHGLFL